MKSVTIFPDEPIIYAGDTHGYASAFQKIDKKAIREGCKIIVQVGDCGVLWAKDHEAEKYFDGRSRRGAHVSGIGTVPPEDCPVWYTCGGNHDNYTAFNQKWEESGRTDVYELAPGCFGVRRGSVVSLAGQSHLFFGGAFSIDKMYRKEGVSWWPEEIPSKEEFDRFFDSLNDFCPAVVVSHDVPARVGPNSHHYGEQWRNEVVPKNLENALANSEWHPELWFFGHHHIFNEWDIDGTKFVCCGLNGQHHIWRKEND
jgi:predicted phosphodiesterase